MDGAMDDATVAIVEDDASFGVIVWLCSLQSLLLFDDSEPLGAPIPLELLEAAASGRVGTMAPLA